MRVTLATVVSFPQLAREQKFQRGPLGTPLRSRPPPRSTRFRAAGGTRVGTPPRPSAGAPREPTARTAARGSPRLRRAPASQRRPGLPAPGGPSPAPRKRPDWGSQRDATSPRRSPGSPAGRRLSSGELWGHRVTLASSITVTHRTSRFATPCG